MSRRRGRAAIRRRRLVQVLRGVAGVAWLTLALAVFRVPLSLALRPLTDAMGLDGLVGGAAPGFVLRVTSVPPGAQLWVDGVEQGTAPVITNVVCREGQTVRIRLVKPGLPPWEQEVGCRQGRTLLVRARLEKVE